jgi:hypothetical protein
MHVSISSDKACHWRTSEFEKVIHGPKIESFRERSYGDALQMVCVILETQNPQRTLRHHTRYFPEQHCLYCHVVLSEELEQEDERSVFEAIASTIQTVLRKLFRKAKGEDFDSSRFEADLMQYLDECIHESTAYGETA